MTGHRDIPDEVVKRAQLYDYEHFWEDRQAYGTPGGQWGGGAARPGTAAALGSLGRGGSQCPGAAEAGSHGRRPRRGSMTAWLAHGQVSDCCGAPVAVEGRTTQFHRCMRCGKPCDAVPGSSEDAAGEAVIPWEQVKAEAGLAGLAGLAGP